MSDSTLRNGSVSKGKKIRAVLDFHFIRTEQVKFLLEDLGVPHGLSPRSGPAGAANGAGHDGFQKRHSIEAANRRYGRVRVLGYALRGPENL